MKISMFLNRFPAEPLLLVSPPFVNIRGAQGNEMIRRIGGAACVPLDHWTSKLT